MFAQVLAGVLLDEDVDQRCDRADGPAEQGAAQDPGSGIDGVSGQVAIKGRQQGDVLEGIYDVDKVGEGETVLAERAERFIGPGRPGRGAVGRRQHRKFGRRSGFKTAHAQSFSRFL